MRAPPSVASGLAEAGLAGFARLAGDGTVLTRDGVLSAWLPEPGTSCFESPLLSSLEADLGRLGPASEPLALPGVRLSTGTFKPRCDILIARPGPDDGFLVLTTMDQADRPIDHWIYQQKREQRLLEEQVLTASRDLAAMNENLRQFTAMAAHDLQAPLRQISAFAGLLRGVVGGAPDPEAEACIDTIETCAMRLHRMISGLLDCARLSAHQTEMEPVSLDRVIADARLNLAVPFAETGGTIAVSPLPEVSGSPALLVSLFQNLIANSLRHCATRPPHVAIAAEETEDGWLVSVTDNGIGIAPEHAEVVFGSFVRLGPGQRREGGHEGVGLGLSIARRIAEIHRWRLYLDTGHSGAGARFCIALERARPDRRAGIAPDPAPADPDGSRPR